MKTELDNNFLFGKNNVLLTVVEAKQVLYNYDVLVNLENNLNIGEETEESGFVFAETQ